MATGIVKWFNETKGFGFIKPDEKGEDVFVHISAVKKSNLININEGDKVSYELIEERGKKSASNLKMIS